ncbi:disease resistance protein rpm1 [Quercus suber]|uniref:Disease resistance protein rpm1 n=1 Tax=Quercus suber TaxID=58331 RepID=A0AAW0LWN0_QUESU
MAEIALAGAIGLLDVVLPFLPYVYHKGVSPDINEVKELLKTMRSYLKDTEGREETEGWKDRVQNVRNLAYETEDAIEEFIMAEIALAGAIGLLDVVLPFLPYVYHKGVSPDINEVKELLKTMRSYLKDTEGREETEGWKDRVQNVRNLAYKTEDAIEEFMSDVTGNSHHHRLTTFLHNVGHSVIDTIPIFHLSSQLKDIKAKINSIKDTDAFRCCPSDVTSRFNVEEIPPEDYPISRDDHLLKLKLSKLENSPLEALQDLPSLKELHLYDAYNGKELVFEAKRFLELRMLVIEQFSQLCMVVIQLTAVPKLQKLAIRNCDYLKMLCISKSTLNRLEERHVPKGVKIEEQ